MPSSNEFTVSRREDGRSLLQLLRDRLSLSGKRAKACLDRREVFVNGARVWMAKHPCRAGDAVRVGTTAVPAPPRLDIVHLDDHLIAVDKPPGRVSDRDNQSVEALLRRQLDRADLRALHRLDRDTSGLLLFTPAGSVRERYLALFREKEIEKTYHLILRGDPRERETVIRTRLDGREAETRLRILRRHRAYCEAECRIPTGRKHQIRRHLRRLDCTLAGDRAYNTRERIPKVEQDLPRQMLHAETLSFPCPFSGTPLTLHAPPPEDFRAALKRLGLAETSSSIGSR